MTAASFAGRCLAVLAAALLAVGGAAPTLAKRKDDVVVMKNGDHFTGEIEGLRQGELIFKSKCMIDSGRPSIPITVGHSPKNGLGQASSASLAAMIDVPQHP